MRALRRLFILTLVTAVFVGPSMDARAQFDIKKRLKKQAEKVADRAIEGAGDEAANQAEQKARNAVQGAVEQEAAEQTSGIDLSGAGALGSGGASGSSGVTDFRELKALLPKSAAGKAQTDSRGEKGGAFGIVTSNAKAEYGDNLTLTITDLGTLRSAAMLGYGWLAAEIDSENDDGYERTTQHEGYPAYEKFTKSGRDTHAELSVIVGQRFVVSAEGSGISMDALKGAVGQVDLGRLQAMSGEAAPVPNGQTGTPFEPVDFAALKGFLPASFPGLARTDASGQKTSALGINMSSAEGSYGSDDKTVQVTITDMGNLTSLTMLGYSWLSMQMDNENDSGFERTTKFDGHPAYEKFERHGDSSSAQIQVVAGQRFIVSLDGANVPIETLRAGLKQIDLAKLASLQ